MQSKKKTDRGGGLSRRASAIFPIQKGKRRHAKQKREESAPVDADVGEGPAVEVLRHGVEAGDEAVHQTLDGVVVRLAGFFDQRLWFVCFVCFCVEKGGKG